MSEVLKLNTLMDIVEMNVKKPKEKEFLHFSSSEEGHTFFEAVRIMASKGDEKSRTFLLNQIFFILSETEDVCENNIDSIILEYNIDYFSNIYSGLNCSEFQKQEAFVKDIDFEIEEYFRKFSISIEVSFEEKLMKLAHIIYQELYGLSIIDELVFDGCFNEVACNRYDYLWIQYKGVKRRIPNKKFIFSCENNFNSLVESRFTINANEEINAGNPLSYSVLLNGTRVTALRPPIARFFTVNFRMFTIGKSAKDNAQNEAQKRMKNLLELLVCKGRRNVAIIGEQGSGKTTAADNLIISMLDENLGIGLAENIHELNISSRHIHKNVVELQYTKGFKPSDLTEIFFRLNRDIVIYGEVRNPQEAFEMIKAMLRQARGSLFTFHSSGTGRMIHDLRQLLMQTEFYSDFREAQFDVADAIDLAIHIKLCRNTGRRYIYKISEINANEKDMPFAVTDLLIYDKEKDIYGIRQEGVGKMMLANCMEYELDEVDVQKIAEIFDIRGFEDEFFYV